MAFSLALFRHNQSFTFILLLIFLLFLWIPDFMNPMPIVHHGMPLYQILEWFTFNSAHTAIIIAFVVLILQGVYINFLVSKHDLVIRSTYFPILLYIILGSIIPDFRTLSPTLIANSFILFACNSLLNMYKLKTIDNLIFNASLLIGIASLISFQTIFFYALVIVSLIIFRPFSWREWTISICGILVPYIFLLSFLILFDKFDSYYHANIISIPTSDIYTLPLHRNLLACYIAIMVIAAYFKINAHLNSTTVKIKKGYSLLRWFIVICFISFILFGLNENSSLILLAIPISIILSNYFLLSAKSFISELLLILLLTATALIQINYIFNSI